MRTEAASGCLAGQAGRRAEPGAESRHDTSLPGPRHLRAACAEDREPVRAGPAWRSSAAAYRAGRSWRRIGRSPRGTRLVAQPCCHSCSPSTGRHQPARTLTMERHELRHSVARQRRGKFREGGQRTARASADERATLIALRKRLPRADMTDSRIRARMPYAPESDSINTSIITQHRCKSHVGHGSIRGNGHC